MITITTLKIMSPHVRTVPTVQRLLDHLTDIHYLTWTDCGYKGCDGTAVQAVDDVTATSYVISQTTASGQRAHRIEMERGNIAFELCMLAAGVRFHATEAADDAVG